MYRRELEISFTQRIKEVEDRFSGDQESVAERFQADVLKLEQHYQCELEAFSESHVEQKLHWEAQIREALDNAEDQRRAMEEAVEQERECQKEEWTKERYRLQNVHEGEKEELMIKNKQLQNELDVCIIKAQTKEIELSRQLNDLHNRLQENLETKDELLAQSEDKVLQTELVLTQTMNDFEQERAKLLSGHSELEAKYRELLLISEKQISERIELLTEQDDLKMKIDELEMLLRQAAVDFELERKELQEHESILKKSQEDLETKREELITEREMLKRRIKELEMELSHSLASNELGTLTGEVQESRECISFSGEELKTRSASEVCINNLVILAESSNEEQVSFLPFLTELGDEVETITETPDAGRESIINHDQDHGKNSLTAVPNQICDMHQSGDSSPKEAEDDSDVCCSTKTDLYNKNESVCLSPEGADAHEYTGMKTDLESREEGNEPAVDAKSPSLEDGRCHETAVDPSALQETGDPREVCVDNAEIYLRNQSHDHLTVKMKEEHSDCAALCLDEDDDDDCADLLKLQALYNTATDENILLHQKIALLQQKSEILESLLAHNSEKIKTGNQVLEENYALKVKMLLLLEHVKALETKALEMTDLQIKYEDCICENAKLKDQNSELEKRVWSLESGGNDFHDIPDQQFSLVDEISSLGEENHRMLELFGDLEEQEEIVSAMHPSLNVQTDLTFQPESDLKGCCAEFEKQNLKLRKAITELQDKSQTLSEATHSHR